MEMGGKLQLYEPRSVKIDKIKTYFQSCAKQRMDQKGASKNFMAFGGGMRFCVGTDFTKVQMAVFLHCLVTKHRFKKSNV